MSRKISVIDVRQAEHSVPAQQNLSYNGIEYKAEFAFLTLDQLACRERADLYIWMMPGIEDYGKEFSRAMLSPRYFMDSLLITEDPQVYINTRKDNVPCYNGTLEQYVSSEGFARFLEKGSIR